MNTKMEMLFKTSRTVEKIKLQTEKDKKNVCFYLVTINAVIRYNQMKPNNKEKVADNSIWKEQARLASMQ